MLHVVFVQMINFALVPEVVNRRFVAGAFWSVAAAPPRRIPAPSSWHLT